MQAPARLHDGRIFSVGFTNDQLLVEAGEPDLYDASLECEPITLNELLAGDLDLETARIDGRVVVAGDHSKLRLLVGAVPDQS